MQGLTFSRKAIAALVAALLVAALVAGCGAAATEGRLVRVIISGSFG